MIPTTQPRRPLSTVVSGLLILTYPLRLANHFWREAGETKYDTNARAREVLLAGIENERKAA